MICSDCTKVKIIVINFYKYSLEIKVKQLFKEIFLYYL